MRWRELVLPVVFALPLLSACDKPSTAPEGQIPRAPATKANTASAKVQPMNIAGLDFALIPAEDTCTLVLPSQTKQTLDLPKTCDFHRLETGEIQVEKGHYGPVFLIASSVPNPGPEDYEKNDCDTRITAVTIKDGKPYIQKTPNQSANCLNNGKLDDVYFLAPSFVGMK